MCARPLDGRSRFSIQWGWPLDGTTLSMVAMGSRTSLLKNSMNIPFGEYGPRVPGLDVSPLNNFYGVITVRVLNGESERYIG